MTSFEHRERRTSRPKRTWFGTVLKWGAVAAIWGLVLLAGVVVWYASDLPDLDAALAPTRRPAITVLARDGSELATLGDYYGRPVRVDELPPALPLAVLAAEDRRFYRHFGLDPIGIGRAAVANIIAGGIVQGGSTITQQAAKNLFLTPDRTLKRKVQELLLALWLERKFSKDQILAIYLNRAYFGAGTYGVDAAARKYFDKPASRVSTYQAAMLAGLLKAPSRYNPLADVDRAVARTRVVLARMVDAGFLSDAEVQAALRDGSAKQVARRRLPVGRYFVDWVIAQLRSYVSDRDRDIVVETTLDPGLQRAAEARVEQAMASAAATKGRASQAALVAMAADGAVRAMVGGRDYEDSAFNRASQALRQPGSAFKPIVYTAGLEAGLTPDSRFADAPLQVAGWAPKNFSGEYRGDVTVRDGLADSINTIAVQVAEHAGRGRVVDAARRLGITADLQPTPSLALGADEVSLVELTAAYAAFANGGQGVFAYGIETVRDDEGRVLYRRSGSGIGRVIARAEAAAITDMLVTAIDSGTGRAARFGHPAAGKTGTSQNYRDAWFVGFSAAIVCGVWVGNDDDRPMRGVIGGGLPAQLWRAFMADAHAGQPPRPLPSLVLPDTYAGRSPSDAGGGTPRAPAAAPSLWDRLMRVFGG